MLGERLRTLRLRTNQTQQQIADQLGITRAAYSHFENDRNEPDGDHRQTRGDFSSIHRFFIRQTSPGRLYAALCKSSNRCGPY